MEAIAKYTKLLIKTNDSFVEIKVCSKKQGKTIVSQFAGITTPEQAEKFLGKEVYIETSWLPKLDGEYYYYQLEGLQVVNQTGDNLGKVSYLFDNGGSTVLASKTPEKEYLIPFIKPYLINVELASETITVDWEKDF